MAYIDPITGAYVADSLDALPPGYNQPKAGNEANVAQMRAQLNSDEALRQQQAVAQAKNNYLSDPSGLAKFAMERMPGASFVQGLIPSILAPFQIAGSALYGAGNQAVNPQTANFNADTAKAMRATQYIPPTQAGRDISEGIAKVGQAVGPLPELWVPQGGKGFTPDDLRVAGRTATEDFRNFGSDYANAKAGLQRDYPTAGSRAAQFTDVAGDLSRPLAEKAYDMYMNPRDAESFGINPMSNLSGLVDGGGPMYAVKPKGGNWPTNLGSTLPLKEQGALGEHLSSVQYNDPIAVFKNQLQKHYPRGMDNRQLTQDWEDYVDGYVSVHANGIEFSDPNGPAMQALKKEASDKFAESYNAGTIGAADIEPTDKKLYTASQIEATLPAYNSWVMGPYQKYITNQMGTGLATDPLLQAVNESGMPPNEIFGQEMPRDYEVESLQTNADRTRKAFVDNIFGYSDSPQRQEGLQNTSIGKITATTPEGLTYENALDSSLYPKGPYAFRDKNRALTGGDTEFPAINKLDRNALISDFLTDPTEQTGFTPIRKQVFKDLLSGNISPDKLSNVTPATITRQMIKDKMAEFKEAQLSKKGAAEWIPKRAAQMPTDMAFDDGSKMTIITPEIANADEAMTARDLGQITIDLNQCVGAGCHATQDYPGHGPFLVPHTGKPPRGKVDYDKYSYLKRLKDGEIEIASLKDPEGVSQATIELKLDKPKRISSSQKEAAVGFWLEDNKTPEDVREFYNNKTQHGIDMATVMAVQKYPELQTRLDNYNGDLKKSVQQIKGYSNNEIKEEYVPQVVQWLNANADQLTDVRDLDNLPNVHDLTRSYNAVGKLMDKHSHWYSPTVEKFFDEMEKENALPRFFTTEQFGQLAEQMGVDLTAEPPKKLSDWDKQTLREEVYSVLVKDPDSLYLQDNLKDDYVQNLDILFGDRKPEGQVPVDIHRKLADMLLDHNGKYREQLVSTLGQLADKGPNGWINDFTEPQIANMLNIMASWFEKHPMEKLPTNVDFDAAIRKHPNPFSEINVPESPWHSSENDLANAVREMEPEPNELDHVTAIRQRAYENASEEVRNLYDTTFLRRLYEGDMDARQSIVTDMEGFPQHYGLTNYSPAARNAVIERVMQEGIFWPHENPQQ
jgi:hypothetical protein